MFQGETARSLHLTIEDYTEKNKEDPSKIGRGTNTARYCIDHHHHELSSMMKSVVGMEKERKRRRGRWIPMETPGHNYKFKNKK